MNSALHLERGYFSPASGLRNNDSGAIGYVGTHGLYWSGSPNSATNGYNLWFSDAEVKPSNNNNRSNGCPIRPVQEFTDQHTIPDNYD